MRTDLKIGIVVGIVVAAVGIFFFVGGKDRNATKPVDNPPPVNQEPPAGTTANPPAKSQSTTPQQSPVITKTTAPAEEKSVIVLPPPATRDTTKIQSETAAAKKVPESTASKSTAAAKPDGEEQTIQSPRYHTVARGESLYTIAEMYYGQGKFANVIYEANKNIIKNPDKLQEGWKLRIPLPEEVLARSQGKVLNK